MFRYILIIAIIHCTNLIFCQVNEDFSDGNFFINPVWTGDTNQFEINTSSQLQLKSSGSNTSYLSSFSSLNTNFEWSFWTKLSFQTSASNNARFYLISDQANLEGSLNGYYIQIGGSNDSIALYKQSGTTMSKVISGSIAYTNNTSNTLQIRASRNASGDWSLYSDPTGGSNFQLEGIANDTTFKNSNYCGIYCKYTSSNATKIYFDNININPIYVDTIAPILNTINIQTANKLELIFSENLDKTIAEQIENYQISPSIGIPINAKLDSLNPSIVYLDFPENIRDSGNYQLTCLGIKDIAGNSNPSSGTFSYYLPKIGDIIINEIMADPTPRMGLPEFEYIELYNKSNYDISIENWQLLVGSYSKVFSKLLIPSKQYLIVCSNSSLAELSQYGNIYGFSSLSITNTGQTIVLQNALNQIISTITFDDSWYKDDEKADGGWSLEQIDPLSPCLESKNWAVSNASIGGTPGKVNSVNAINKDLIAPELLRVSIEDSVTLILYFNEKLNAVNIGNTSLYNIDNGIGNPISSEILIPEQTTIKLKLNSEIKTGVLYTIRITDSISDCSENKIESISTAVFAIPQPIEASDIIINEIMFNPKEASVDFVELYNKSNKVLNLADIDLYNLDDDSISSTKAEISKNYLIFPNEFVLLSTNSESIRKNYQSGSSNRFIDMPTFPSYNIDNGTVLIKAKNGQIIDLVRYSGSMHYPLLISNKGVSLERINYNISSQDTANWHSASELVGFATPAYKNSQYSENTQPANCMVELSPEIFSPDNDAHNDVLMINYKFNSPDFNTSIRIYDANGRLIRNLIQNNLSGISGTYIWDGYDEQKQIPAQGIYIVLFESFNPNGEIVKVKKTIVLAKNI